VSIPKMNSEPTDSKKAEKTLLTQKKKEKPSSWALDTRGLPHKKGAGNTDTLEPHKTGRNRPRAASC
jgi:hypothetical protein